MRQDALDDEELEGPLGAALLREEHLRHAARAEAPDHLELGELKRRGARGWRAPGHVGKKAPLSSAVVPRFSEPGSEDSALASPPLARAKTGVYIRPSRMADVPRRTAAADRRRDVRQDAARAGAGVRPGARAHRDDRGGSPRRAVDDAPGARGVSRPRARTSEPVAYLGERAPRARVHRRHGPERLARVDGQGAATPRANPPGLREDHRDAAHRRPARAARTKIEHLFDWPPDTRFSYYDGFDALHTYGGDDDVAARSSPARLGRHPDAAAVGARARRPHAPRDDA